MTATASLEDYIKQFKQDYKKYLSSETSSTTSSIDTADLLSETSSESSSLPSRPTGKNSIKSISSLKKRSKKTRVKAPVHMKPLHSTPLKMIQEEDEFAESKYKLSDYLPSQNFDINEYLPKARAAKNQRVNEILASLEEDSENFSVLSSVDTEALLNSSDEELPKKIQNQGKNSENSKKMIKGKDYEFFNKNLQNDDFSVISSVDTEALLLSSDEEEPVKKPEKPIKKQENQIKIQEKQIKIQEKQIKIQEIPETSIKIPKIPENRRKNEIQDLPRPKFPSLSMTPTSVFAVFPKKMSLETSSISIPPSKPLKNSNFWKPSDIFNSFRQPSSSLRNLKVCTCILSGSIFAHQKNCAPVTVLADFSQKPVAVKRKPGILQAVVIIQEYFRRYLRKKKAKNTVKKEMPVFYIDQAAKTLNNAYKELKVLKSLASDRSSEISIEGNEFEVSSVDTDSLLNSSFSSILSRNY